MKKLENLLIQKVWKSMNKMMVDERGMGVVEIAIIIVALIAVALLFQEKIMEFVNSLFSMWVI